MPVNGAAAVASLSEPAEETSKLESSIGEVLLVLAGVAMRACLEVRAGGRVDPMTKSQGGDLLAELIAAQAQFGGNEFVDMVRRVGRLRYRAAGLSEAAADKTVSEILQVVSQINATLRAFAH